MLATHRAAPRRRLALCLALAPLPAASAEISIAPGFSADIVTRDAKGLAAAGTGRLYVENRTVRIEAPGVDGYFLVDGGTGTALFVQPARRLFMDAKQSTLLTQIFVPIDPKDPCPQWRTAATNAGASGDWTCELAETGAAGGRGMIEYRADFPYQRSSLLWIDADLKFPVKLRAADGTTIALENIRISVQPAIQFSIPPGFQKSDPQGLIDRIKRSDVWVGQPETP
jgi:hypothetical protein